MKTYICISLAFILAALPMGGQSANGASVQTRTMTIAIPVQFGVDELPDWLPSDIKEQVQILIESSPDAMIGWATLIVIVVIVIVTAVILYCLWKCSQMIPPPVTVPPPPPDDPAFVGVPHALVFNMEPCKSIDLQACVNFGEWTTLRTLTPETETMEVYVPNSDRMFFRLEAK